MVSVVRLAPFAVVAGLLVLSSVNAQRRSDPSLVCVNATRDWNEYGEAQSLDVARDFLNRRVKPECPGLAQRVRGRIATLERVRPRIRTAAATPRPETHAVRQSRPVSGATRSPADDGALRRDGRYYERSRTSQPEPYAPSNRQPTDSAAYEIRQPNWFDVIDRYPELRALFNRGGSDLCARCIVGQSGYLGNCRVAGAAATDPAIRYGARRMISMIHVSRRDGASAAGASFRIPTHFGQLLPPPAGGYCRQAESDFR